MSQTRSLRFTCPSCDTRLAPVEGMRTATQVVTRKCRKCKEHWRLVIKVVQKHTGVTLDIAEFTFLGRD